MTTIIDATPRGPKFEAARDGLPPEQRADFEALALDYRFAATQRTGNAFVSYGVLADLIRRGWRRGEPS